MTRRTSGVHTELVNHRSGVKSTESKSEVDKVEAESPGDLWRFWPPWPTWSAGARRVVV
jgi:hypothetical protein